MDVVLSFLIFLASMITCLLTNISIVPALIIGWCAFVVVSLHRGSSFNDLLNASYKGVKDSLIVVVILLILGMLTASWRSSGTILFFVYYGIKLISPKLFIVLTFVLCSFLSYALGTSFGVVGTMGVIFMVIARSGGANELLTAGAIMSGIYFGDCCSPAASSMALTASLCHIDSYNHSRRLLQENIAPLCACLVIYGIISVLYPLDHINTELVTTIENEFDVSWYVAIPAVVMIVLPLLKVNTRLSMLFSIICAGIISIVCQDMNFASFIKCLILGYQKDSQGLGPILRGGGLISMVQISIILAVSSTYSHIFSLSGMLNSVRDMLSSKIKHYGAFPIMLISSIIFGIIFCNQTIAILMCSSILEPAYTKAGLSNERLALDIGCSAVDLCGLIPWCIACSVPLNIMGVSASALPFSFLLYLLPLFYLTKCIHSQKTSHEFSDPA